MSENEYLHSIQILALACFLSYWLYVSVSVCPSVSLLITLSLSVSPHSFPWDEVTEAPGVFLVSYDSPREGQFPVKAMAVPEPALESMPLEICQC